MLTLDSLQLQFPVIQAALSGYSDAPMRAISREHGAELTLCEVFLDLFVVNVSRGSKSRFYLKVSAAESCSNTDRNTTDSNTTDSNTTDSNTDGCFGSDSAHPTGAQLMGSEPDMFVVAAGKLVEFGFDLIDLNFACPVKKVLGRHRGGYLMTDPPAALEIVARVREAIPPNIPLTVKLRKGFDDSRQSEDRFFELLDGAFDRGISAATVHGRTVLQRYEGLSDWDFIRRVKQHVGKRVIIGSGDLFDAEIALRRMTETGVDGIALARGVIGNPWLFRQVRAVLANTPVPPPPTLTEQAAVMMRHYDLAEAFYGAHPASDMRKFGVYYAKLHPNESSVRDAFVRAKTRDDWIAVLQQWYGYDAKRG
ncbi:MAG: tRNA-dihydrouridine synthase family protein [Planctomycetaceae bacterium]|nr:tRNA-dihydrouridine synthase family protein [Planctomycetaceae bacterium]